MIKPRITLVGQEHRVVPSYESTHQQSVCVGGRDTINWSVSASIKDAEKTEHSVEEVYHQTIHKQQFHIGKRTIRKSLWKNTLGEYLHDLEVYTERQIKFFF